MAKLKAKCLVKTGTYDASGRAELARYIDKGDMCTLDNTLTKQLTVQITYPSGGNTRTAYIKDLANFQML